MMNLPVFIELVATERAMRSGLVFCWAAIFLLIKIFFQEASPKPLALFQKHEKIGCPPL